MAEPSPEPGREGPSPAGLPPGTAIYTGTRGSLPAQFTAHEWTAAGCRHSTLAEPAEAASYLTAEGWVWLALVGLHEVARISALGELFALHPLVIEDICNVAQRPRLDDFGGVLFVAARHARFDAERGRLVQDPVSLVLTERVVLSFTDAALPAFEGLAEALSRPGTRLRESGADYLFYRLLDLIVDEHIVALEQVGETVEQLEDTLLQAPEVAALGRIHDLRRDLLELQRALWPLQEVVRALQHEGLALIRPETRLFLTDLEDHLRQAAGILETELALVGGLYEVYQNALGNLANQRIQVLTVCSSLFLPLTFIVGLYGMNFEHMPELHNPLGYPITLAVMLGIAAAMLAWFRARHWL